ncbi:YHS domain-containing protein [Phototrophicus methaneseepsis]|uniref:histidine kinase n=1 Tax=Phototrophicus methaneseepsis TaxID=2710758 RepID=A0A7S8E5N0_9CHLR|nr:histidine kinase [Phototrophicus methaneseepsis]QPC80838.1 YHS domain-containing protein [Phototrophicus methaneseepsis]
MTHTTLFELCCIGGSLFVVSNLWFFFRVLRPLHKLVLQAESLTEGNFNSFERQCGGIPEIRELQRAMSGMVGHVGRAQEQRRAFAEQLADGQENERKRIARELHDDTVQSTIAVTQGIDIARNWLKTDPDRAAQMLQLAREQAVEIVNNLRNLIGGLRPPALEELGLIPALEMQLGALHGITGHLHVKGERRRMVEAQELTLFRVAQEALYNVTRHSAAEHVHIHVNYQSEGVLLSIQDNGQGFPPPTNLGDLAFQDHYGLLGIQERVNNLGGWFKLESEIGRGTMLQAYLPTTEQSQPDNLVRDPVCSAFIEPQQAYGSCQHELTTYYFCCPVCQGAFQKDPALYLGTKIAVDASPA